MDPEALVGKTIGNHEVLRELGRGGMGIVYRAYEHSLQRTVALKVLPEHLAGNKSFVARFAYEARAAAQLNHPNVVHIYSVGEEDGIYYIAMEFVEGRPLNYYIEQRGKLELGKALFVARQTSKALAAAHNRNIIHRDIKPHNIMIDMTGNVKVMDFGLAKVMRTDKPSAKKGAVLGTPVYMSPEQCEGGDVDERTDIYSLGITLFEMLAGRPPFQGKSKKAVMYQIARDPLPKLSDLNPSVPHSVEVFIERMTARDPGGRYPSAVAVRDDLGTLLRGGNPEWPRVTADSGAHPTHRLQVDATLRDELADIAKSHTLTPLPPRPSSVQMPRTDAGRWAGDLAFLAPLGAGAVVTLRQALLAARRAQDVTAIQTVQDVFSFELFSARIAAGLVLLAAWPLAAWIAFKLARCDDAPPRHVCIMGLLCASSAYLCSWLPLDLVGYAFGTLFAAWFLAIGLIFAIEWWRTALVWLIASVLVLGAAAASVAAVEGTVALLDLPFIIEFARVRDAAVGAGSYTVTSVKLPLDATIRWRSTRSDWLDGKAGPVLFEISSNEAIPALAVDFKDKKGTSLLRADKARLPFRFTHAVTPDAPYGLMISGGEGATVDITFRGILDPKFQK